jgi:sulfur carrier protein ThiS
MVIYVTLHTVLRDQFPEYDFPMKVSLDEFSTIEVLINNMGILDFQSLIFLVNGINVEFNYILNNFDRIDLIPAISGG